MISRFAAGFFLFLAAVACIVGFDAWQNGREAIAIQNALDSARPFAQSHATLAFEKWSETTFDAGSGKALEWRGRDSQIIHMWSHSDNTGAWTADSINRGLPPVYSIIAKSAAGRYFKVHVFLMGPGPFVWQVDGGTQIISETDLVKTFVDLNRPDLLVKYNLPKAPA